jgi:hypothetical protein
MNVVSLNGSFLKMTVSFSERAFAKEPLQKVFSVSFDDLILENLTENYQVLY